MAFIITDPCIGTMDKACVSVCPVDCIHFDEGQDQMLYINPDECIDCGACQPACPVNAIFPEEDVPEDQQRFIEINSLWFEDPAAARAKVGGGAPAAPAAAPAAAAPAAPAAEAAPAAAEAPAEAAPAASTEQELPAEAPSPTAEAVAQAGTDAAAAATAAAAPSPALEPARRTAPAGTYKYGENGVEGKCAICGTYVIKGGVPFGRKSVLCPEDAKKQTTFLETAGSR